MGRKRDIGAWIQIKCEYCDKPRVVRRCSGLRFCNRSCSNAWQHANGVRKIGFDPHRSTYDTWVERYGVARAQKMMVTYRQTMSNAIRNADMSHQREVARQLQVVRNKANIGKTYEEIYGPIKAGEIKAKLREAFSGSNNPAYGKVYSNGGRSVKGHYKGFFFRSLLEYSFMKHLESEGLSLDTDVNYENIIVHFVFEERDRTYRSDFHVPSRSIVYEVKPAYALKKVSPINEAKWNAARDDLQQRGVQFQVVTELDFPKIAFTVARQDGDVVWKEETFKYFKESK